MQPDPIKAGETSVGDTPPEAVREQEISLLRGLSGKLLVLTIAFVMLAEVLIFIPTVANFRNVWLRGHLDTAEAASIVFLDTADPVLSEQAQAELLSATGSLAVVIREGSMTRLMASVEMPANADYSIDLSATNPLEAVTGTLSTLFSSQMRIYRVMQPMKSRNAVMELVQADGRLKSALRIYARNVLLISLAISVITASLVFLALYTMIVRPIRRISDNMMAFAQEPDNAALIHSASARRDEIGIAERQLAAFERELHQTLRQRQHLADLGLAVSKINHDLRNILSSAQLFSDRIAQLPDPTVQRLSPKLLRSINRAIEYTRSVLAYGKAIESEPQRRRHLVAMLVDDVVDLLSHEFSPSIDWRKEVAGDLEVFADAEQLFRIILNLARNAAQALDRHGESEPSRIDRIVISAAKVGNEIHLRVGDTGPGITAHQREKLFKAFGSSSAPGGTGLGLAIASELARSHGGRLELESTSPMGTAFLVVLPDAQAASIPQAVDRPALTLVR